MLQKFQEYKIEDFEAKNDKEMRKRLRDVERSDNYKMIKA